MDDLRQRFASLDRVPVPELWSDVEHRLEALATTVPTDRPVGRGPAWRSSGDRAASRGVSQPVSVGHQIRLVALAALMTLVLLGVAVAVGTGLIRLPAVVPPSTSPSPSVLASLTASQAPPSPSVSGPVGGGPVLVQDLPRFGDHGVHDVAALDAGTGARTPLGTLPGAGVLSYVFQQSADGTRLLILNDGLGDLTDLQAATEASRPFGFVTRREINYGTGLVLSPRGDLIAGVDNFDRPTRIVISGVESGSRTIPSPSGVRRLLVIGWAPDQTAVLAMGCRPCNTTQTPQEPQTPDHGHVYIVPIDGAPWRELLNEDRGYFLAAWSPDGSTLAVTDFACGGKTSGPRCAPGGRSTLSLVAVADGRARAVTSATERNEMAAWSADGRRIAYLGGKAGDVLGAGGIYVMNADGTGVQWLADTTADVPPVWSPDGQWLMYRKDWDTTEWWIVPAAGGAARLLGTFGGVAW